jgi:hypothetical protein
MRDLSSGISHQKQAYKGRASFKKGNQRSSEPGYSSLGSSTSSSLPSSVASEDGVDRWLVIKLPKENKNKFSMDLIDSQADEGKEWLDGPLDLDLSIKRPA